MDAVMGAADQPARGTDETEKLAAGELLVAPVKWFDAVKGYGFLAPPDGADILIHYNLLHPLGRKSIPEGATVSARVAEGPRGRQAVEILAIDLSTAVPQAEAARPPRPRRAGHDMLLDAAGDFVSARVRWFNRTRGYGFLYCDTDDSQAFLHVETLQRAGIEQVEPGDRLDARIAQGPRGLLAVEVRVSPPSLD